MLAKFTGGCRCGEVRYRLAVTAIPPVYCCHCPPPDEFLAALRKA